jgi:hypothetical protein
MGKIIHIMIECAKESSNDDDKEQLRKKFDEPTREINANQFYELFFASNDKF